MTTLAATTLCLVALAASPGVARAADPALPAFDAAAFADPKPNPWMPLAIGTASTLRGTRTDGPAVDEWAVLTVQGPGPVILDVPTTLVLDEAFEDGRLVERTFDYVATDRDGNVWYFGEDVTNFRYDDAGRLTGTDAKSAWRAGVDGARPGISVPGVPAVGLTLFQEHAPANAAMDYAEVVETGLTITGPAGTFKDVFKTFETSTTDADLREFKYYAPVAGMIRADEDLSPAHDKPGLVAELQP